ncbi:hypothetical protein BDW22DRAFT_1362350 [Trametopsis cervina]|nr:hypothetical protein BDW22DRAFT_1362350 [Trametopsis cervina]
MESTAGESTLELRKPSELPYEIIEYILSYILGSGERTKTNLTYSEISWTWRLACARYLFSSIVVAGADKFPRFVAFIQLERNKRFASCIRSLLVKPKPEPGPHPSGEVFVTSGILSSVLDALPNLKDVHLHAVRLEITSQCPVKRTDVLPPPRLFEVDSLTLDGMTTANGGMTKNLPNFLKIFRLFARIGTLKVSAAPTIADLNAWTDPDSQFDTYPPSIFPPQLQVDRIVGDFPVKLWHHFLLRTSTIEQQSLVAVDLRVPVEQMRDIGAFLNAGGSNVRSLVIHVSPVTRRFDFSNIAVDMDLSACTNLERVALHLPGQGGHSRWTLINGIVSSLPIETVARLTLVGASMMIWSDLQDGLIDGLQRLQSLLSRFYVLKEVVLVDINYDDYMPDPIAHYKKFVEGFLLTDTRRSFQLLYKTHAPMDSNFT